jgi:uncharacterized protein with HEPN domain
MSKKRKDWRLYLLDMLECIKRIENYVEGLSYEQFLMNDKTKDAVVRNIEIIGEAARNIPKEIHVQDIPFLKRELELILKEINNQPSFDL